MMAKWVLFRQNRKIYRFLKTIGDRPQIMSVLFWPKETLEQRIMYVDCYCRKFVKKLNNREKKGRNVNGD